MASWNVLATSLEGRRDALLMALRRLGKFRRGGYRNVVVGAVESVDGSLARVHEALDADPLLPTALARVVPIEATVRFEAPTAVETLAAAAEPFVDRLAGGSFFVRLERRGLKGRLHTPTVERALGDHVWRALEARGHTPRVAFEDPDAVLVIETVGAEGARERRPDLLGARHVLAVAADRFEHAVVTELGQHVEGIDPAAQHRHLLEAGAPRAVVPEEGHDRQPVLERGLELHAADAEAAVADDHDHLLARARELDPDPHADAVTDGRERPRVHDLPGEARPEPLREPAREREAVDHERRIPVHQLEQIARQARGMDRYAVVHLRFLRAQCLLELRAHARHLGQPGAALARNPARGGEVGELPEHELRIADDRHLGRHVPADARGCRVDLDVGRLRVPRRWLAEVFPAPELEADGEDHVGSPGERLLPRPAHGERVVLGERTLTRAAGVHGNREPPRELAQLGRPVRPEDAVAGA